MWLPGALASIRCCVWQRLWLHGLPFFNMSMFPVRALRRLGILPHRFLFGGSPALAVSTAGYAKQLMEKHRPTGPRVALLTGCLMESVYREINFATVRVLIANNVQVFVPGNQTCCGAMQEHLGLDQVDRLRAQNRDAFSALDVDAVVSNSSGCGLAMKKTLAARSPFGMCSISWRTGSGSRQRRDDGTRVYVDLPCHLVHGQKLTASPRKCSTRQDIGGNWHLRHATVADRAACTTSSSQKTPERFWLANRHS